MEHQPHRFISAASAELSIPECFRKVATSLPGKTAIVGETWQPTYAQLDAQACRVAHALHRAGLRQGDRATIVMRHDAPLVAAVLGVLMVGGIVVVVNPTDPPARLQQVLADASPEILLVDSCHVTLAEATGHSSSRILVYGEAFDCLPTAYPEIRLDSDEVAFLVYTSGSTGLPKGVMLTHAGIVHNVHRFVSGLGLREEDRISLLASLSGGHGVATTWTALLSGATLCSFPTMERGVTGLAAWLTEHEISCYISAASLFRHFMRTLPEGAVLPGIRLVRLGSEPAVKEDYLSFQKHFLPTCRFVTTLSSSETGNITQGFTVPGMPVEEGRLPVGRPAPGMEVILMDEHGRRTLPGEKGEIVVRGRYLARGYWQNDALTRQRFLEDAADPRVRLFRSGDLGWCDASGEIMVVGRNDDRVKIRGYRIELPEVEVAVATCPGVREVVVGVSQQGVGEGKLTAYVIPREGVELEGRQLREALRKIVPSHMVPAVFIFLEGFPHTPHGKIDRQALAALGSTRGTDGNGGSPLTETEEVVATIWAEVFGLPEVGSTEDFFDLGGDSLTAAVVAAKVEATLGVVFDLAAFAEHPTVRSMSAAVDFRRASVDGAGTEGGLPPLVRADRTTHLPLSPGQERIWYHSQTPESSLGYSVARMERITGLLDVTALRQSIDEVIRRHEVLRTTFWEGSQGPVQVVQAAVPVELPFTDLTHEPDARCAAYELLEREMRVPFELELGPLLRLQLLKVGDEEHLLLRVNHHIISDAWSWKVFLHEMMAHYETLICTRDIPAPGEPPLQYADFAAWQRQCLQKGSPLRQRQVEWWRDYMEGAPESLQLPFRRFEPARDAAPEEGILSCALAPGNGERLDHLARQEGATGFMIRLAAFAAQLSVESDQQEFVMGTYATNRSKVELQKMFGFFANLVALRIQFDPGHSLRQWLAQVRQMVMKVQSHSDLPSELLMEELRGLGATPPELQVIFSVSDQMVPVVGSSIKVTTLPRKYASMPWGFTLSIDRWNESQGCQVLFDARVYKPVRARNMLERYAMFLQEIASHPDAALWDLYDKVRSAIPVPEDDSELPW